MEKNDLGPLGVWTLLDGFPARDAAKFAKQVEAWGYGALWSPEAVGRDPFAWIGFLAAHTEKLIFATGIANIYARDPMTMRAARETLAEASGDRFLLGLGVSHAHLVTGVRKHEYKKPLSAMRNYLEAIDAALYMGPTPKHNAPTVIAALREKMLGLAASAARGAHPYLVPPEHTARAREIMGKDAWLCPEQMVLRETDPTKARAVARKNIEIYIGLPNYQNSLKWLGWKAEDFENGGSDKLVDAIVAWGDDDAIAARIKAHHDAGADHVCIQPFRADGKLGPDAALLETFAPAKQ